MPAAELSVVLHRSVEDVFEYLANLENDAEWRREWAEARRSSGDTAGVGSTYCLVGKSFGRRFEVVYEVTAFEALRAVTWKGLSGPLPLTFHRSFEALADGGTQVTFRYEANLRRLLRFAWPLLAHIGKRQLEGDLPRLRQVLAARSS